MSIVVCPTGIMGRAGGKVLAGKAGQYRDVKGQYDQRQFHGANLRHRNMQQVGKSNFVEENRQAMEDGSVVRLASSIFEKMLFLNQFLVPYGVNLR